MVKKLSSKDAEKLRRRAEAKAKRVPKEREHWLEDIDVED